MSIRNKVLFLLGISLALALFISVLSLTGSDEVLDRAIKFNQSTQIDIDLARTLAKATTTIKADPINPDTGPLFKQVNEIVHANITIAREGLASGNAPEFVAALDETEQRWDAYYKQSMSLYDMATTDPASAIGMVESVYESQFKPFQDSFKKTLDLGLKHAALLQDGINRGIHRQRLMILLPLIVIMALLLVLALAFILSLNRAVHGFQLHSDRLSDGDLTTRFQDLRRDEISQIGRAVNRFLNLFVETLKAVRHAVSKSDGVVMQLREIIDKTEQNFVVQNQETTQMVTAVEQLTASFRRVAEMSGQASKTAAHGEQIVQEGSRKGQETISALRSIDETVGRTGQLMTELDDTIREVALVTQAIQGISEQTTLLALNAAIEAARAGEQGRGFAVVASEVKQLSNRTKSLTISITDTIGSVQVNTRNVLETLEAVRHAVSRGVESGESTGQLLADIDRAVHSVAGMLRDIAVSTDEQSAVTQDMADRIERVSRGSELMRAQLSSVMSVMSQLETASSKLNQHLGAFTLGHDEVTTREDDHRYSSSS